jgi:hypothetical protein
VLEGSRNVGTDADVGQSRLRVRGGCCSRATKIKKDKGRLPRQRRVVEGRESSTQGWAGGVLVLREE